MNKRECTLQGIGFKCKIPYSVLHVLHKKRKDMNKIYLF